MSINTTANYTTIKDIKEYWLDTIAPNYFDFDDVNLYSAGIFGYVNEVMSNATEDAFSAANTARREFYPITAKYTSSLYKMATLQQIQIPLTVPATCRAAMILKQDEIIENSTITNGIYECTIDSCLKIFADNLQFMLDYPIKIISKKAGTGWSHTVHYDVTISNTLSANTSARYISNKLLKDDGVTYLVLFVDCIRQMEMVEDSQVLIRDSILNTTTMDVDFDGNLANFEVYYKENQASPRVQLQKVLLNGIVPTRPFVFYEIINYNKIRLTFSYNTVFVPKFNSEIITQIYTSEGAAGNFTSYDGDLICSSDSEDYPYNSGMTILGKVNGSAYGGVDQPDLESLRNTIMKAYSTNSTITTSNDLQIRFDEVSRSLKGVKVLFKKKRDDPFIRLFGAYVLLRDNDENILPTNTLRCEFMKSMIVDPTANKNRVMIKPGTVYKYKDKTGVVSTLDTNDDGSLKTIADLTGNETDFLFTNPFLVGININPNIIGFYMNSISATYSIDYTYVNDESAIQFISSGFIMKRNAIQGTNYYEVTTKLMPASDLDPVKVVTLPDEKADDYAIRAKYNGKVLKSQIVPNGTGNKIITTIVYDSVPDGESATEEILSCNTLNEDWTRTTGYKMLVKVGDTFIANDIIATKRVTDLGNLRIIGDIADASGSSKLTELRYYTQFNIQDYDDDLKAYTLVSYIGTDDELTSDSNIVISHGIFNVDGKEVNDIAVPMKDFRIEGSVLYNNDGNNISNRYTKYTGLNNYTLTNTYVSSPNELMHFVEDLSFIRSTIDYNVGFSADDYKIIIDEVPLVRAVWAINEARFDDFVDKYTRVDALLQDIYYDLENNFSIDTKLYNTYGRAQFYTVGNSSETMVPLDNVRVSFRFGVSILNKYSAEDLASNFRLFVKDYVEDTDHIGTVTQDIYILNMVAAIKENFSEIASIEYYGFNNYDYMAQKIIGPANDSYIDNYIPEFINLDTLYDNSGVGYPAVNVNIFVS